MSFYIPYCEGCHKTKDYSLQTIKLNIDPCNQSNPNNMILHIQLCNDCIKKVFVFINNIYIKKN